MRVSRVTMKKASLKTTVRRLGAERRAQRPLCGHRTSHMTDTDREKEDKKDRRSRTTTDSRKEEDEKVTS